MLGVIIGRFQVPELHDGHKWLFLNCLNDCDRVLVIIGIKNAVDARNPLSFWLIKQMILSSFDSQLSDKLIVICQCDVPDDAQWSDEIDQKISRYLKYREEATLYFSRDPFINTYKGMFYLTMKITELPGISGTDIRDKAAQAIINNADFRRGIIYATNHILKEREKNG